MCKLQQFFFDRPAKLDDGLGEQASIIGTATEHPYVALQTALGGQRLLEELEDDPLPRIC